LRTNGERRKLEKKKGKKGTLCDQGCETEKDRKEKGKDLGKKKRKKEGVSECFTILCYSISPFVRVRSERKKGRKEEEKSGEKGKKNIHDYSSFDNKKTLLRIQ